MFRSAELAQIAGTTVRALRHYHQIGLLPEPPRTSGGYRTYGAEDLVRLLRVRRLAALGIPLERIGELLDAPLGDSGPDAGQDTGQDAGQRAELDALDAELSARIEDLTARREQLRQARRASAGGGPLDVPAVVAGYADRLRAAGVPAEAMAFEQGAAILMHHFTTEGFDEASAVGRMYAELADEGFFARMAGLSRALFTLPADAGAEQVAAVAQDVADVVGSFADVSASETWDPVLTRVLEQFVGTRLNDVQRRVLHRAGELL